MSEVIEEHFRITYQRERQVYMRRESLLIPGTPMESGIEYPGGQSWNDAVTAYGEPEGCDQYREDKEWIRYRGPAWWEPEDSNVLYYNSYERWWETKSTWNRLLVKEDSWKYFDWFSIRVTFITPGQILLRVMDNQWNNMIGPAGQSSNSLLIDSGVIYTVRTTASGFIGLLFETNNVVITDLEFRFVSQGP